MAPLHSFKYSIFNKNQKSLAHHTIIKCKTVLLSVCTLFLLTQCNGYFTPTNPNASLPSELRLHSGAFAITELLKIDSLSVAPTTSQIVMLEQQLLDTTQSLASLRPEDSSYKHSFFALNDHPALRLIPESSKSLQISQTAFLQSFAPFLTTAFSSSQLDSLLFKGFSSNGASKSYPKQPLNSIVQPSVIRSGKVTLRAENGLDFPVDLRVSLYTASTKHLTHTFSLSQGDKDSISFTFDETLVGTECFLTIEDVSAPNVTNKIYIDNTTASLSLEQSYSSLKASSGYFYAADTLLVQDTLALALPIQNVDGLTSVDLASLELITTQSLDSLGEVIGFQGSLWYGNQLLSTYNTQLVPGNEPFKSTLSTGHHGYAVGTIPLEYRYELRTNPSFPTKWSDVSNLLLELTMNPGSVTAVEYNKPRTIAIQKGFAPTSPFWSTTAAANSGQEQAILNGELAINAWGKAVLAQAYTAQNDQGTFYLQDTVQLTFDATQKSDSATRSILNWDITATQNPDLGPIAAVDNSYQSTSLELVFQPPFGVIFSKPFSSSINTLYPLSSFNGELILSGSHTFNLNENGMDSLNYLCDSLSLKTVLRCYSSSNLSLSYALEAFGDTIIYLDALAPKDSLFSVDSTNSVYELGLLQVPFKGTFNGTFDDTLLIRNTDSFYIDVLGTYHFAL